MKEIDSNGLKRFTDILTEVHSTTSLTGSWLVNDRLELFEIVEILHFKVLFWAVVSKGEYTYGGYSVSGGTCKVKQEGLKAFSGKQF